jgi:hypothetical protein
MVSGYCGAGFKGVWRDSLDKNKYQGGKIMKTNLRDTRF